MKETIIRAISCSLIDDLRSAAEGRRGRRRMVKSGHTIWRISGPAVFLIINLSLGTLAACRRPPDPAVTSPPPKGEAWLSPERLAAAGIVIGTVDEQDLGHAVVTGGRVTFDDSRVTHVFAPVNGRVIRVLAQP